jgi:hypothetical protein
VPTILAAGEDANLQAKKNRASKARFFGVVL